MKEIKPNKTKNSSKDLLPNGGVAKAELGLIPLAKSGSKSKFLLFLKTNWIKIALLSISLILIFYFVMVFSNWLTSRFTSLRAFEVVFQTSQFTGVSFDRALFNGFILSALTVVVVLIIASLIAYALAKFDFSGKIWITAFIFTMTSLPPIIIIIPYFIQTNSVSDFVSGNIDLLSFLILIIGFILIILDIVIYKKSKNYKKKLFITTLIIIIIFFACCSIYIRFSNLLIVDITFSSYIILILGIIVLVLDIVIYIVFKILNKQYSWKLFILSIGIIFVVFGGFIMFVLTMSDPFDLRDNIFGLVFPYSALNLPLATFVLQAFFREIPEDLWKAAKVDGASNFQIFRKIILPLTIPGIFTCAILVFIASWNELLFAQIWLVNDINHTVPRAILRFVQSPLSLTADWNTNIALMAATTTATVPLVILVLIFQKKIISGLTRGAVKG